MVAIIDGNKSFSKKFNFATAVDFKRMLSTDQITQLTLHKRTYFWVNYGNCNLSEYYLHFLMINFFTFGL